MLKLHIIWSVWRVLLCWLNYCPTDWGSPKHFATISLAFCETARSSCFFFSLEAKSILENRTTYMMGQTKEVMLEHIMEEHELTFKHDQCWDAGNLESVLNVTGIWRTNYMAQHDIITSSQLYNYELWLNIWCISLMNTNSLPLDWRL